MKIRWLVPLGLAAAALFVGLSSFYTLNEGDNALIVRLGAPVGVEKTPGLKFKAPFIDTVIVNDARLLLLEPAVQDGGKDALHGFAQHAEVVRAVDAQEVVALGLMLLHAL